MILTGLRAHATILGAAYLAQAERDHEPARAEIREPACRVLVLLTVVAWRSRCLYPCPIGLGTAGN